MSDTSNESDARDIGKERERERDNSRASSVCMCDLHETTSDFKFKIR